jgi:toxin ParE1/3/4
MSKVFIRAVARRDLADHYMYFAERAGIEAADRFLTDAEGSFTDLVAQPAMGAPLALRAPELAGMRKWRVNGFENILIFYLARPGGVSIVRVLHAARDWWGLLGIER